MLKWGPVLPFSPGFSEKIYVVKDVVHSVKKGNAISSFHWSLAVHTSLSSVSTSLAVGSVFLYLPGRSRFHLEVVLVSKN